MTKYKITYDKNKTEYINYLSKNINMQKKTFKTLFHGIQPLIKVEKVNEKWIDWIESIGGTLAGLIGIFFVVSSVIVLSSVTEPNTLSRLFSVICSFTILPLIWVLICKGIKNAFENPILLSDTEILTIQEYEKHHQKTYTVATHINKSAPQLNDSATNTEQKQNQSKINDYIYKEIERINKENRYFITPNDKPAISELAKMNVLNNPDYMKDAFSATDKELEEIYTDLEIKEQKKIANHSTFEGRINSTDKRNLKNMLGFTCSACGKNMENIYGSIGRNYIELHHLIPYSEMQPNDARTLSAQDFCVLCPDCHRMIHKLDNANDIDLLKRMIKLNQPKI